MAYGDFKDLNKRIRHVIKHIMLLKIQNMMDIKEIMVYKCFDKNIPVAVLKIKIFLIKN